MYVGRVGTEGLEGWYGLGREGLEEECEYVCGSLGAPGGHDNSNGPAAEVLLLPDEIEHCNAAYLTEALSS